MASRRDIVGIVIGAALVAVGLIGAFTFHEYMFGITFWRDVLMFSGVAVVGAALMVAAAVHLWRSKRAPR